MLRAILSIAILVIACDLIVTAADDDALQVNCEVTIPNRQAPPGYPPNHGNVSLAMWIPENGVLVFSPRGAGFALPDGSLALKFGWFRHVSGELVVEGRRLDGSAPPLRADVKTASSYGEVGFQPSYLIFPTPGCWQITGSVADKNLTVVLRVEREGSGPRTVATLP